MEEDERNRMIFAKDENVGERQYTLIGHYINCTDLQITTGYIPLNPVTSVPWMRCPLAGVRSLLDEVSSTLALANSVCPQGGKSLLVGEVSRLPRVTAGVHTSQMGGKGVLLDWVWRHRYAIDTCHVEKICSTLTLEGSGFHV